jgi:hypothetical protein
MLLVVKAVWRRHHTTGTYWGYAPQTCGKGPAPALAQRAPDSRAGTPKGHPVTPRGYPTLYLMWEAFASGAGLCQISYEYGAWAASDAYSPFAGRNTPLLRMGMRNLRSDSHKHHLQSGVWAGATGYQLSAVGRG